MLKITVEKEERCNTCSKKAVCSLSKLFKLIPKTQIIELDTNLTNNDIPVPKFTMYCDEFNWAR